MSDSADWGLRFFLGGAVLALAVLSIAALFNGSPLLQPRVVDVNPYYEPVVVPLSGYVLDGLALLSLVLIVGGVAKMAGADEHESPAAHREANPSPRGQIPSGDGPRPASGAVRRST